MCILESILRQNLGGKLFDLIYYSVRETSTYSISLLSLSALYMDFNLMYIIM